MNEQFIEERLGKRGEDGAFYDGNFVCNQIRYGKDAIIEASAGTGKTYTLQSIVLKLLLEKTIDSVKNLLLVTYTEKAAGELKDKIRTVLEEAGCLPSDFDEVTICTIHSFCRSLLTEYAFENRVPMQVEIGGSDKDLVHRAVRTALQSAEFKARYGEAYGAYMKAAGLKSTDDLVVAAESLLEERVRIGQPPEEPQRLDDSVKTSFRSIVGQLCPSGDYLLLWDILKLAALPINGTDNRNFGPDFDDFQKSIGGLASHNDKDFISALAAVIAIRSRGANRLNPRLSKPYSCRLAEHISALRELLDAVDGMVGTLPSQMLADLVFLAWPEFKRLKDEVSALTFDDLVNRAHDVIVTEAKLGEKSALLKSIRHKYRIALVDEFQDTDKAQWDIFRCIFSCNVNKIADGVKPNQGSLFVVGDPKQAIYSFRGADIATYLEAKRIITDGDEGKALSLATTYRSSPELVKAFNKIFEQKEEDDLSWFADMKEGGGSIIYKGVKEPPAGTKEFNGIDYHPDFGKPVELLESIPRDRPPKAPASSNSGYGNKNRCLPEFLRNAAREIKRLVALSPACTIVNKGTGEKEPYNFSYRDMCILVRGHADAEKAREILAAANIPFSIYKEQGIYASAEAETLLALFDFLSAPSRRGHLEALLLTPLFGYRPDQLEARCKQEDREFSKQIDVWQELVSKKEWIRLFESVMNDTLLAHPIKDDSDFDRRWAATRQILDKLLECVGRKAQTINEFADILRSWRQDDKCAGEDGALRRKESEADCVQIMTMHVSKGLEFPVVFVAWGFGPLAYKVEPDKKESAIREEKRLLYVALTRAKHKLYLPWSQWAQHERRKTTTDKKTKAETTVVEDETGIGSVGSALLLQTAKPNSGFLARGIRALFGKDDVAKEAVVGVSERLQKFESMPNNVSKQDAAPEYGVTVPEIKIYEFDVKALARQKIDNDSYSSVHRRAKQSTEPVGDNGKGDEIHDDAQQNKAKTLLPRNNISGDVFHDIMETLCNNDDSDGRTLGFCTVGGLEVDVLMQRQDLLELIGKVMRRHQLPSQKNEKGETTELELARMVWRALNVPIGFGGRTIVLKDIAASNRRAELEFVVNRAKVLGDDGVLDDDDLHCESTFNGKIDLLVRPDGLGGPVYILDWKTNSLSDYGAKALECAMTKSDYHLQYQFYSQAVRYWLHGAELGGVAYLFVRAGEKSESLKGDIGVFVADRAAISRKSCCAAIKEALK